MADPKHPRHYDEAFKRQIVQLYESGKPSRKIRRRGPTSSGPSSWATPTPGSRRPTTGSRSPSAWPTASTTRTIPSPSSCSAAADSTYAHHNQEPNPRKQQKPLRSPLSPLAREQNPISSRPQERSNIPIEHCDTAMSLLKELSVPFNAFL